MADNMAVVHSSGYSEDIDSTNGTALVSSPCVIYDITFSNDTAATITCTVHDAATATAASKKIKVVIAANSSIHFGYPRGKLFTVKAFAKANAAGLDASFDYD